MILLILILCILPVALSLDAFEIAQETAGDYRLSAARRFLMSFCFSFFTFIIPVICSVLFRFFFRGLHILDILIPASFIDPALLHSHRREKDHLRVYRILREIITRSRIR